jgi:transposase
MAKFQQLHDLYRFPGFRPHDRIRGVFGDPRAVVIPLNRSRKKRTAASAGTPTTRTTTNGFDASAISRAATSASTSPSNSEGSSARGVPAREGLDWLADNPLYTKRFAFFVGRRCRETAIQEVADELHLDWHAGKELEKQYMREQLRRAGSPTPRVIGIDEISVGKDRSEESMDEFFAWLGPDKSGKIRLAVMDMWKAFRNSTARPGMLRRRRSCTTNSTF